MTEHLQAKVETAQLVVVSSDGKGFTPIELDLEKGFSGFSITAGSHSRRTGEDIPIDSLVHVSSAYLGDKNVTEEWTAYQSHLRGLQRHAILQGIVEEARRVAGGLRTPYFGVVIASTVPGQRDVRITQEKTEADREIERIRKDLLSKVDIGKPFRERKGYIKDSFREIREKERIRRDLCSKPDYIDELLREYLLPKNFEKETARKAQPKQSAPLEYTLHPTANFYVPRSA